MTLNSKTDINGLQTHGLVETQVPELTSCFLTLRLYGKTMDGLGLGLMGSVVEFFA